MPAFGCRLRSLGEFKGESFRLQEKLKAGLLKPKLEVPVPS